VHSQLGIEIEPQNLLTCENGASAANHTVKQCPISLDKNENQTEVLVVLHFPQVIDQKSFAKLKVPQVDFKAQLWNKTEQRFQEAPFDILEQSHFGADGTLDTEYEMYLPLKFKPSKLEVVRLVKISKNETKMLQ